MRAAHTDSPTKQRLLDAAQKLMLRNGFVATTVDEICETAKLTKGSFFYYFESKDELGRVLLERYCAYGYTLHEQMAGADPDPLKRVYAYLDNAAKMATDPSTKGCLVGMFAQELCDLNPEIRACCEEGFAGWMKQFGEELAKAKATHVPKKAFKPQELAGYLISILEGSLILGKTQQDMRILATNLRHYKAYVKSLFEG